MADAVLNNIVVDAVISNTVIDGVIGTASTLINTRFPRGGIIANPIGLSSLNNGNYIVWVYVDMPVTVNALYGLRRGGTGATINARRIRSGVGSNFLASDLSLVAADTVYSNTTVQNTDLAIGDIVEIMLTSNTGAPTQVAIQIGVNV